MTTAVVTYIQRLADGKPDLGYVIGSKYTGRREWSWDSRSGTYSESLPLVGHDEFVLQQALVGPAVLRKRRTGEVRQK